MSSVILLLAVAASVFAVFLILAALAWGIRTRRDEGHFVPAPEEWKDRRRSSVDSTAGSYSDWQKQEEIDSPSADEEQPVPEWMQEEDDGSSDAGFESERVPIGAEPESRAGDFLRGFPLPLSAIMDIGKLVQQIQAAAEKYDEPEERKAAIRKAAEQLMEQQPDNEFLREMLESLKLYGYSAPETESQEGIRVVRTPGRTLIHVDGEEYYSVEEIPDPVKREQARRILASLKDKGAN